jgi:suppressor of ftsI/bilirubin oxidase
VNDLVGLPLRDIDGCPFRILALLAMNRAPTHAFSRRTLLGRSAGVAAAVVGASAMTAIATKAAIGVGTSASQAGPTGTLSIPPLLSPDVVDGVSVYTLEMETGTHQVLSGVSSSTCGFNGSFLGPTMQWTDSEAVRLDITNRLGADSTVHFHGAHVPAKDDGGPQLAFADGQTWPPSFTVNQQAATLWYHPHALGTTSEQIAKGLAGMILVGDDNAAGTQLPSDYGVDDIPLILQCLAVDSSGDIKYDYDGYSSDNLQFPLLCNGSNVENATLTYTATRKRIRLRLLNGSLADILTVSRTDNGSMTQIATEQGYLNTPEEITSLRLVAGERAEICLDLTGPVTLQTEITAGYIKGGSGTHPFLTITPNATDTPAPLPVKLNSITRYDTSSFTERTIDLQAKNADTMAINGVSGTSMAAMMANMITTTLGAKEIWTINNQTAVEHSFHLHDVPFQIISVNGKAPTGADLGWKDIVDVPVNAVVKIAMEFTDYADSTYMYMVHCHIAPHEDEGMMLGLMVES